MFDALGMDAGRSDLARGTDLAGFLDELGLSDLKSLF